MTEPCDQAASGINAGGRCVVSTMSAHEDHEKVRIPSRESELLKAQMGVRQRGTVFYADHLQILVKWDSGRSQSLRPGVDRYRTIE